MLTTRNENSDQTFRDKNAKQSQIADSSFARVSGLHGSETPARVSAVKSEFEAERRVLAVSARQTAYRSENLRRKKRDDTTRFFVRNFTAISRLLKKKLAKKEVKKLSVTRQIEQQSVKLIKFPERVAAVIGKTYSIRGDDPKVIPDDEAIMRIRDLLDELDDTVVERNKNKRLSR